MDLKTLDFLLVMANVFALIPTSKKIRKTFFGHKYKVFFLILFTFGLGYTLLNRIFFYKTLGNLKLLLRLLVDISMTSLNFYILIGIYYNKDQWSTLVSNLKVLESVSTKTKHSLLVTFFLTNILFCFINFYIVVLWSLVLKSTYYKCFGFETFQQYIKFFYNFIIYVILKMITLRYRFIKQLLFNHPKNTQVLKKCTYSVYLLKQTADIFNKLFGWPILLTTLNASLRILYTFEAIIRDSAAARIHFLLGDIGIIFLYMVQQFLIKIQKY